MDTLAWTLVYVFASIAAIMTICSIRLFNINRRKEKSNDILRLKNINQGTEIVDLKDQINELKSQF